MAARHVIPLAALLALSACSLRTLSCSIPGSQAPQDTVASSQPGASGDSAGADTARQTVIAFLGDSLTSGYGLTSNQSFPSRIQELFATEGYGEVNVVDAGVSGDTTADGRNRVDQVLNQSHLKILVVALGGNDALRGLTAAQTHDNIEAIVQAALAANVRVLLAGMEAPTNLGQDYRTAFHEGFVRVSDEFRGQISFVPFLLEGVAGVPSLNQADGIHPNEEGAKKVADLLYPALRNLVDLLPPGVS